MAGKKREREDEPEKKPEDELDNDFLDNWANSMLDMMNKNEPMLRTMVEKYTKKPKASVDRDKEETQDDGHNSDSPPPSPPRPC